MKAQYSNQLISSFLLFLENRVTKSGESYFNISGNFYPSTSLYNGLATYSSQFRPIIADHSIGAATHMTGVYLNSVFITPGTSGFSGINYAAGQLYFTGRLPSTATLSGAFTVNEFNFLLTDKSDEEILFETKYSNRPTNNITATNQTGLNSNQITYPVIFLKNDGGQNEEYCFGGIERTETNVKGILLCDSQFNLDAISSILKDSVRTNVPLLSASQFPFNYLGYHRSGYYNYDSLVASNLANNQVAFIEDVFVSKFNTNSLLTSELKKINPNIYVGIAEWTISKIRTPRC